MVAGLEMMGLLLVFDRRPLAMLPRWAWCSSQSVATAALRSVGVRLVRRCRRAAPRAAA
jgi:hypothetical protein